MLHGRGLGTTDYSHTFARQKLARMEVKCIYNSVRTYIRQSDVKWLRQ